MNSGNSKLNPSSLLDLKAELHKKYDSFNKAKLTKLAESTKHTPFRSKLDPPKEKKSKPAPLVKEKVEITEEDKALKKSREALEAKAKLYDKIVTNRILIDDEQSENYLVDFQRKVLYESPKPSLVQQEKESDNATHPKSDPISSYKQYNTQEERLYSEVRTKDFENLPMKDPEQPIHYQDVQFNEIRDHGTGYFAFSTDEDKRKEQIEELNTLRRETEEHRNAKQMLQKKRRTMLQNRLAKICERKNIDPSVLEAYKSEAAVEEPPENKQNIESIPVPEIQPDVPKKTPKVRPWDIGKETLQQFVPAKKSRLRSQNDWIEEQRGERNTEFAPPSTYR